MFVRHTDTVADTSADSPLSRLGQQRAELLADVIQDIDVVAGVDAIYASEHRHTQETAAAVAKRLELDVSIRNPYEVVPFMAQVLRQHKGEIVLVVTLGDVLAPLVEELHGSKNIPPFGRSISSSMTRYSPRSINQRDGDSEFSLSRISTAQAVSRFEYQRGMSGPARVIPTEEESGHRSGYRQRR